MAEGMDDELQRLLDTELQAEALVREADARRERLIQEGRDDAHHAEQQFEARLPELRGSFMQKAEERAAQGIAGLARRYEEHQKQLHHQAQQREQEAIEAAVALLIDPDRI